MSKRFDVTALGELLIDFTQNGMSEQGNPVFEANPGGAPCNVLSMLSRLGRKTAFIGKVGNDGFGKQLTEAIEEVGINAEGLLYDDEVHTTLALVHTLADGDRDFSFYRNPGADMNLNENELPADLIKDAKIFHFGTPIKRLRLRKRKDCCVRLIRICVRRSGRVWRMRSGKLPGDCSTVMC